MLGSRPSLLGLIPCVAAAAAAFTLAEPGAEAQIIPPHYPALGGNGASLLAYSYYGTPPIQAKGYVTTNSLNPETLVDGTYLAALDTLKLGALTSPPGSLTLTSTRLLDDEQGRELLQYLVRCALPYGVTLTSGSYQFHGSLDLAPGWRSSALETMTGSLSAKRWVSACLMAHANAFGDSVKILVSASHAELHPTGGNTEYLFQEAAFYGNIFDRPLPPITVLTPAPPYLFACVGWDAQRCRYTVVDDLKRRACARVDASGGCGFDVVGPCFESVTASTPQDGCQGFDSAYSTCYTGPFARFTTPPTTVVPYTEVVRVYLLERDFYDHHLKCSAESCSHDVCVTGPPLQASCDPCVASIAAVDT